MSGDRVVGICELRREAEKHPVGSTAARMLSWAEIQIGELTTRVLELEEQAQDDRREMDRCRMALHLIEQSMDTLSTLAAQAVNPNRLQLYFQDFAPFRNVMAFHGVEPYAKKPRKTKLAEKD